MDKEYSAKTYLSVSDGGYRVIHQGLPICKDFDCKTKALDACKSMRLEIDPMAWMGNQGVWIPSEYV